MSAAELARKINVPANRVTQILNGTRAIPGDTALRRDIPSATSRSFAQSTNQWAGGPTGRLW